jgi:hypothetical protein
MIVALVAVPRPYRTRVRPPAPCKRRDIGVLISMDKSAVFAKQQESLCIQSSNRGGLSSLDVAVDSH